MYPHERSLIQQTAGKPFTIIGVNTDEDRESIREIAKSKNLTWRSFWDGTNGPISKKWCITAYPRTYLIDTKGKIRYKQVYRDRLDRAIEVLMKEAGHQVVLKHAETN